MCPEFGRRGGLDALRHALAPIPDSPAILVISHRIRNNTWPIQCRSDCCPGRVYLLSPELLAAPAGCPSRSSLPQNWLPDRLPRDDCVDRVLSSLAAPSHDGSTVAILGCSLSCLASAGPLKARMAVRRFFCPELECPRRIFAELMPGLAAPHGAPAQGSIMLHEAIGSALGGEYGSRLTVRLAMGTTPEHAAPTRETTQRRVRCATAIRRDRRLGVAQRAMLRRDRCGPGAGSCYRAIRPASCLPSSIRGRRGKGRRTMAPSRPASTNERRTRWRVIASRSRASLICWSDHAGPRLLKSTLGRMRHRVNLMCPRLAFGHERF